MFQRIVTSIPAILNIHGFASTGAGKKATLLRGWFPEADVVSPSLSHDPTEAMRLLEGIVRERSPRMIVGTSLGGFYGFLLASRCNIPVVLINPSIEPWETLKRALGKNVNQDTGVEFEMTVAHLDALAAMWNSRRARPSTVKVLLGAEDEIIDVAKTAEFYRWADLQVIPDKTHRFEGLEEFESLFRSAYVAIQEDR